MRDDLNHEEISEKLLLLSREELSARDRELVLTHLESCADCRLELRSIEALTAAEPLAMTAREQRKLHARVGRAVEPNEPIVIGSKLGEGWARRFAPTMAAAALLLLVAVIGLSGLSGQTSNDESATGSGADLQEDAGGDAGGSRDGLEEEPAPEAAPGAGEDDGDGSGTQKGEPKPVFESGLRASALEDEAGGSPSPVLDRFATAFTTSDAAENEGLYVSLLAKQAPGELRGQVSDCGGEVRERRSEPVLAAYGTVTQLEGEKGLELGFAYSKSPTGPLTDYMVWTWPLGSCSSTLRYTTGELGE